MTNFGKRFFRALGSAIKSEFLETLDKAPAEERKHEHKVWMETDTELDDMVQVDLETGKTDRTKMW